MKKIVFLYSLILVGVATNNVFAQSYVFRVLANKGSNLVKVVSVSQDWQPVKTGAKLKKEDELMLSENAYMGLVSSTGKTIELKQAGDYKVADLASKLNTQSASIAGKYVDFVFNQITQQDEVDFNKNPQNHTKSAGSVERGISFIDILGPVSMNVFNPVATIRWSPVQDATLYTVVIKNIFENTILTKKTSSTELLLDLNDVALKNEKLVIVTVSTNGGKVFSDHIGIKRLSLQEQATIRNQLDKLVSETNDETALSQLIQAAFFEDNGLVLDALMYYENALKIAPDVDDFKIAYQKFLERNQ